MTPEEKRAKKNEYLRSWGQRNKELLKEKQRAYYAQNIKKPPESTTNRKCLCCKRVFASAGAHNRICFNCKHTEPYNGDPSIHHFCGKGI